MKSGKNMEDLTINSSAPVHLSFEDYKDYVFTYFLVGKLLTEEGRIH